MGGKTEYSRFYNSQIPIDKDKNITTTGTGEPLDGEKWQENYPGINDKIETLKPKEENKVTEDPFKENKSIKTYEELSFEMKKKLVENDISPDDYKAWAKKQPKK